MNNEVQIICGREQMLVSLNRIMLSRHMFSVSKSCSFISADHNDTTPQTHTVSNNQREMCVCVYYSGTAAHKVSLISWQQAHWTTDRELNLLLVELRSKTSRQNGSTAFSQVGCERRCVFVLLFLHVCEDQLSDDLIGTFGSLREKYLQTTNKDDITVE